MSGDNGFEINLESPYHFGQISDEELSAKLTELFPAIEINSKTKCGGNYLYLSDPPRIGIVHVDQKMNVPFAIKHWPKSGITPEIESIIASLHIN